MPNGGEAVPADDLGTYRKSEVARLQASHDALLAACKAALPGLHWANCHGSRCDEAIAGIQAVIAQAESKT